MIRRLLERLAKRLMPKTVYGMGGPYLTRYTLIDTGKNLVRVKLHRFHRSDEDGELHSHPWEWAVGVILVGGYKEERLNAHTERIEVRNFLPGMINGLKAATFHRVELLDGECWTLFITGPVRDTWFFYEPTTKTITHWRDFIRAKGLVPLKEDA